MTEVRHRTVDDGRGQFIPISKSDILAKLCEHDGFAAGAEREKFRQLGEMLASIFHYDYFKVLERLRNEYHYFSPEIAPHVVIEDASLRRCYGDLVRSFDKLPKEANFIEVPHTEIDAAHRRRTLLRVEVTARLQDFREVLAAVKSHQEIGSRREL